MDSEITENQLREKFPLVEYLDFRKDYQLIKVYQSEYNYIFITYEYFSGKWNYCFIYSTPGMERNEESRIILKSIEQLKQLINILN